MTPTTASPSKLTTLALIILLFLSFVPAPAAAAEMVDEDWLPTNVTWYTPYESGNTLQYDGESVGYAWHAWIYNSGDGATTWTPPSGVNEVDVLVVAGGGSGGKSNTPNYAGAGGGGAGGLREFTDVDVSSESSIDIVIGRGGAAQTTTNTPGNDGSYSQFLSSLYKSNGGGGGGASQGSPNGKDGGSGGGATYNGGLAGSGNIGSYSPSEGNDGGGAPTANAGGSGGGGAGGVGSTGSGDASTRFGGIGKTVWGRTYSTGGDGGFSPALFITSTPQNSGNGGCGSPVSSPTADSAAGANGIIIIRYASATGGPSPEDTPPLISFIASPRSGTLPLNITFNDTSSRYPTNWSWSLRPTGGTSWTEFATTQHLVYQFSTVGYYDIKLTASNEHGSATRTQLSYIQITEPANTTHPWHFNYDPTTGIYTRIWFDTSESLPDISLIWTATLLPIITLLGSLFFVWIWLLIVAGSWLYTQDTTSAYVIGILSGATMAGTASLIGADGAVLMVIVVGFAGAGVLSRVIVGKG